MIRAILWDIDNTLLDFDVAEGTKMITVFMYKEAGEGGMAYFDDLSVIIDK